MKNIRKLNRNHDQIFEKEIERREKLKRINFEDNDYGYMVFMI
jgi:hypothetical protein